MERLKFYISIILARVIGFLIKLIGKSSGTSFVGLFTLKFNPDFLRYCSRYITGKKFSVTGTNGKTTTAGLIAQILEANGKKVIHNAQGANMLTGIANVFAKTVVPTKRFDSCVLESDEAYLSKLYDYMKLDYLVVTNLFRDQLDRYGELATTKKFIQNGINLKQDLTLVLNADDPLVASIEGGKSKIYYGIKSVIYKDGLTPNESATEEAFTCQCGNPLKYERKFYAQQGHYYCDCGFKRPEPKYSADVTLYKKYSVLRINGEDYKIPLTGLFNAYNALGAIALALELGIDNIRESLLDFRVAFGRSEVKYLNGKRTLIQLIKNPVGANEVLKTVDENSDLLIIINDNYADGRDVSWLWDAEFERLSSVKKEIVVSGTRANDMALRLKYAGVNETGIKIIPDIKKAVDYIGETADNDITILPTYTALLKLNKIRKLRRG